MNSILFSRKNSLLLASVAFAVVLAACGGDGTSASKANSTSEKDIREFTSEKMPKCNSKREDMLIYVTDEEEYYHCEDGDWVNVDDPDSIDEYVSSSSSGASKGRSSADNGDDDDDWENDDGWDDDDNGSSNSLRGSSSSARISSSARSSSSGGSPNYVKLSSSNEDIPGKVLHGYAQGLPFRAGAKIRVNPLTNDLKPREDIDYFNGETYNGLPDDSCGFYLVRGISEGVDIVEIRAVGQTVKNGTYSSIPDTLYAIVNLKDVDSANVNTLTTDISGRIKYLVQKKGLTFDEAKNQAESEFLDAFFVDREFHDFEKLNLYSSDTSMGLWPATLNNIITTFGAFRLERDSNYIHDLVLPKISDIGEFMLYHLYNHGSGVDYGYLCQTSPFKAEMVKLMTRFLDNYTGRGVCSYARVGVIAPAAADTLPYYYICRMTGWDKATLYELNTYSLDHPCTEMGFKKGGVTNDEYFCLSSGNWVDGVTWNFQVPTVYRLNPEIKYGEMTDERDNKVYKTVEINGITWMAQNLNFQKYTTDVAKDDSLVAHLKGKFYCYNDSSKYCDVCGTLYRWEAVMNIAVTRDSAGMAAQIKQQHQGVCPSGWHVSTSDEWKSLDPEYTSQKDVISRRVRARTGWGKSFPDSLGLSILPCGQYMASSNMGMVYRDMGEQAYFLSTDDRAAETEVTIPYAIYDGSSIYRSTREYSFKSYYSIRCVKDY